MDRGYNISVCIAYYKGERFIAEQLTSITNQLSPNDEVIISVDGQFLDREAYQSDTRIKIIDNSLRNGVYNNFQNAIGHASNDIVFLADQDDFWLPTKVQSYCELFENYNFIISDAIIGDKDLNDTNLCYSMIRRPYANFLGNLYKMSHLGCCMAFRKSKIMNAFPFPLPHNCLTHDMWLLMYALLVTKVKYLPKPEIIYRRHDSNVSSGGAPTKNSFMRIITIRCYLLGCLFSRLPIIDFIRKGVK
jgi:glycosyltransferase involved in cell wall biosynthesis